MRYELWTRTSDGETSGLQCFTDSPERARRWVMDGGAARDTRNDLWIGGRP